MCWSVRFSSFMHSLFGFGYIMNDTCLHKETLLQNFHCLDYANCHSWKLLVFDKHSINSFWILLCVASSAYWNLLRVGVDAIAPPPDMVCRDLLAGASGSADATTVLNGPGRTGVLHGTNAFLVIAAGQEEAGLLSSEVEECVISAFCSIFVIANNKRVWVWN